MRNVFLAAGISLFISGGVSSQTADQRSATVLLGEGNTCSNCTPAARTTAAIIQSGPALRFVPSSSLPINDLPDSPGLLRSTPSASFESASAPTSRSFQTVRPPPIWDKQMWITHAVYVGSIVFDVEVTHQGLAHHVCQERNPDVGPQPSRSTLYFNTLAKEAAPIILADWLSEAAIRALHEHRWFGKAVGSTGAITGTIIHLRGGIEWYTHGCT